MVLSSVGGVSVDLATVVVTQPPTSGLLEVTANGLEYTPFPGSDADQFEFFAIQAGTTTPVQFQGQVAFGYIHVNYSYTIQDPIDKNLGMTESGPIAVGLPGGTVVRGTILVPIGGNPADPGDNNPIVFPPGTIIIDSNNSPHTIGGVICRLYPDDTTLYDGGTDANGKPTGVGGWDEATSIITCHPNPISVLVLTGHGGIGGVICQGPGIDGYNLTPEQAEIIREKLAPDAVIVILGCRQFNQHECRVLGVQMIADKLQRSVICNEGFVSGNPQVTPPDPNNPNPPGIYWGDGNWVRVDPQTSPESGNTPID